MRRTHRLGGRSQLARIVHFRTGAGAMGGTRRQKARRRRKQDRQEEQQAQREDRREADRE